MTALRFLTIVGPVTVLYLGLAAAVEREQPLDQWLVFGVAFVLSGVPLWLRRRPLTEPGVRRLGALSIALAVWLAAGLGTSLTVEYLHMFAWAAVGFITLDLALDGSNHGPRKVTLRALFALVGLCCVALGWLALAPPVDVDSELLLFPTARWALLPSAYALVAVLTAVVVRVFQVRNTEDGFVTHGWSVAGLLFMAAVAIASGFGDSAPGIVEILVACILLYGHFASVAGGGRLVAGGRLHKSLAFAVTLLTIGGVGYAIGSLSDRWAQSLLVAVAFVAGLGLYRLLYAALQRAFAPDGGRLMRSIQTARDDLQGGVTFAELGQRVLAPFRLGLDGDGAVPMLAVLNPGCTVVLDAGGTARVRERGVSDPILNAVRSSDGTVLELAALQRQIVRRSEVRPLVDAMVRERVGCIVSCVHEREPEGAILLPLGDKPRLLIPAEIAALGQLGAEAAVVLALVSGRERAEQRYAESRRKIRLAADRTDNAENELERVRDQYRALVTGGSVEDEGGLQVAYSPAMRAVARRAEEIAKLDGPVTVVATSGMPVISLARFIHDGSNRSNGPFMVADCAAIGSEDGLQLLMGTANSSQLGWIRMAEGGTLVLKDLPALSTDAQQRLRDAFSERKARVAEGTETYRVDTRVVATSRVPIDTLLDTGGIDPELASWLSSLTLTVPPLRNRKEDLPSLTLLAIHRACRTLARAEVGIEELAMERLLMHEWPGDVSELLRTIEQAVLNMSGKQITCSALPELGSADVTDDGLTGTYLEVERRLLQRALDRAAGNKSEAARSLALKRTTFLDKLRRHGLDKDPFFQAV